MYGYNGKVLRINLTQRKVGKESLKPQSIKKFLGGRGINIEVLHNEVEPGIHAFDPENRLVFGIGPLCGTIAFGARCEVTAHAPASGILGTANAGGYFGPELKFAGFDQIIVRGRADKPVYLKVVDGAAEIKDASHIWGKDTRETIEILRNDVDKKLEVACIGIAGENLVKIANLICSGYHAFRRGGLGAVMGSKNLKAIAVRGTKTVTLAHPDAFNEAMFDIHEHIRKNQMYIPFTNHGSLSYTRGANEDGYLATRNFTSGVFEGIEAIVGEAFAKYAVKSLSCFGCPLGCFHVYEVKEGTYAGINEGLQFEAACGLRARCGVSDVPAIIHANALCNKYGLDIVGVGGCIAFAMECFEKRLLNEKDLEGIKLKFGNHEAMIMMIEKIAKKEGCGTILSEGVRMAAEKIGKGAKKLAMEIKGLETISQDPRGCKAWGLAYAVSNRGSCHNRAFHLMDLQHNVETSKLLFGTEAAANLYTEEAKGISIKWHEDYCAVIDSASTCKYILTFYVLPEMLVKVINAVTGWNMTTKEMLTIGERIVNLERLYNVRLGLTRKDDTLPERFLKEPMPAGIAKGLVVKLEPMLDEYYTHRGWDAKTGIPAKEKLKELGLMSWRSDRRSPVQKEHQSH